MIQEIQNFIAGKRHKNKSQHTINSYTRILNLFCDYLRAKNNGVDKPITEVTNGDILSYMDHKYPDTKRHLAARNSTLTVLHRFFFENNMNQLCMYITNIKPDYMHSAKIPYTADQIRAAIMKAQQEHNLRDVAILTLLPSSGLRSGELLMKLRYKDFDLKACVGHVLGKGRNEGDKPELFLYSIEARDAIQAYLDSLPRPDLVPDMLLFNSVGADDASWRKAYDELRYHFKATYGLWQFHRFRHFFGTEAVRKYGIRRTQKLMRHKDVASTEIYLHEGDDELIDAYRKDPVEVSKKKDMMDHGR